ncbi:multidrug effflux MFS transporter [Colwellia sp. D2M02]|uniref:multidrug effflux MFS transporter n=1 Tax=Colwellia sp. D2M02 TaxID=2841562 RepID=UPI001C08DB1F|nr:multidrug effflux MFS transporter [Colwellia sp. D2M02]MBU2891711.1 multidrug effflux MFS transporter [Colwellia sp. D2M02]
MNKHPSISLKFLLPLLAAIIAVSPLAIDMYLPAMLAIASDLNTSMPMVQNSLSIYLLGYSLGLILFGPMADKYSRRKLVILGLSGFFIANVLLPFAMNIEQFLSIRFFQAFISSAATVVVPGTIREYYGKDTAKGLSYVSMIMMVAPMLAPSIGSVLLLAHNWQLIFYVLSAYSLVVLILVIYALPEVNRASANSSDQTAKLSNSGEQVKSAQDFTFIERYQIVFSNVNARFYIITSMMVSLAFFGYITAIPYVYLKFFNVSETWFSVLFALNVCGLMLAHFTNTRLVTRHGSKVMLRSGLMLACVSVSGLVFFNYNELSLGYTVASLLPLMASISMIAVNSDALILAQFPQQSGTATAVIGTLRWGAGSLAGPILAYFYDGSALPFAYLMFAAIMVVLSCQAIIHFKKY